MLKERKCPLIVTITLVVMLGAAAMTGCSGDVYVVQEPYWFLYEEDRLCAMHGSPWRYDTFVPVIFAGAGVKAQKVARPVQPADIAPTLSALLGVKPPSGVVGEPFVEVLNSR